MGHRKSCCSDENLMTAGLEFAREVAAMSPLAVANVKEVINQSIEEGLGVVPDEIELEKAARYCLTSNDAPEGWLRSQKRRSEVYGDVAHGPNDLVERSCRSPPRVCLSDMGGSDGERHTTERGVSHERDGQINHTRPSCRVATIPGVRYLGPSTTFGSHEEERPCQSRRTCQWRSISGDFDPKTSTLLETRIVVVCERRSNSLAGDKDAGVIPYRHAAVIP